MAHSGHVALSRGMKILRMAERFLLVIAFGILAVALFSDVFAREVLGQGIYGTVSLAVYALIFVTTFGMSEGTSSSKHLRPTVFDSVLSGAPDRVTERIAHFVSTTIFMALTVSGILFVSESFTFADRSEALGWLIWPIQAAIPLGFGVCAVKHLLFLIDPDLADRPAPEVTT